MTTDEQIARVRELNAAATPGPWKVSRVTRAGEAYIDSPQGWVAEAVSAPGQVAVEHDALEPNAAAIAEYRTLAPLLARKLERAIKALQKFDREGWVLAGQTLADIEAME